MNKPNEHGVRRAMPLLTWAMAAMVVMAMDVTARASETDERIEATFAATYVYKTYLEDDAIKADADKGVVTLTGTVAEESHKVLAQETLSGVAGVIRVDNQLVTKDEAVSENADARIGRRVKLALLFHRNVNADTTTIDVKDGVVTLSGDASSVAQKALTAEYAKDIAGVKEVKNVMTVAATPAPDKRSPGEKLDDASITAQVRMALATHRSTRSIKTKVETRDGEVTLTGTAKHAAEKALVAELVSDIQGVTGVKNQMTIATVGAE